MITQCFKEESFGFSSYSGGGPRNVVEELFIPSESYFPTYKLRDGDPNSGPKDLVGDGQRVLLLP